MREERQMLGQMITQVHQQQNELKELQSQITEKLEANNESLVAIQTTQKNNLIILKIIWLKKLMITINKRLIL